MTKKVPDIYQCLWVMQNFKQIPAPARGNCSSRFCQIKLLSVLESVGHFVLVMKLSSSGASADAWLCISINYLSGHANVMHTKQIM